MVVRGARGVGIGCGQHHEGARPRGSACSRSPASSASEGAVRERAAMVSAGGLALGLGLARTVH